MHDKEALEYARVSLRKESVPYTLARTVGAANRQGQALSRIERARENTPLGILLIKHHALRQRARVRVYVCV